MTEPTDLHGDARLLAEIANDLDRDVYAYSYDEDLSDTLEADLIAWALIEEANRTLATVRATLADRLAKALPDKRLTIDGVGTFERHGGKKRTKWDRDALVRDVLDTRQFDDDGVDASPLDKVLRVWNLGAPRVTALRDMGLDPDEYAETEPAPWSIQLTANAPISESEAA